MIVDDNLQDTEIIVELKHDGVLFSLMDRSSNETMNSIMKTSDGTLDAACAILMESVSKIDPNGHAPIDLIVPDAVKDGILKNGAAGSLAFVSLTGSIGRPISIFKSDDAAAMAAWEKMGSDLADDPVRQLAWARKSRLLLLGLHHNHVGLSLIENGRTIDGLSLDQSQWPWPHLILDKIVEDSEHKDYSRFILKRAVDNLYNRWSPDVIIVTVSDEKLTVELIDEDKRLAPVYSGDLVRTGALLLAKKTKFGWKPNFLLEADKKAMDDDHLLEIEFMSAIENDDAIENDETANEEND